MKKVFKVRKVIEVTCDRCGGSCKDVEDLNFEYATVSARWGFATKRDQEACEAHLCEKCFLAFEQWMIDFGGLVRTATYGIGDPEQVDFEEQASQEEFLGQDSLD